jgi:uncharacterized protein (TIGR02246 family)
VKLVCVKLGPTFKEKETRRRKKLMKDFATLFGVAILASTICACNQARQALPDTHDADVKAITDTEAQWSQATAANDFEKAISYYAEDAVLMTPGAEALEGKTAIGSAMRARSKDPAFSLHFKTSKADVAKSGELGYTWGAYQLSVTDPETHQVIHDHGSYVTTYRKQRDGSWKAEADIASSAVPPAKPQKAVKDRD